MLVAPVLLAQAARGKRVFPPPKMLASLLLIGLAVEIGANIGCRWALGVVGLAAVVPLNASQVAMAALGGVLLFGESPSVWLLAGVCLTIAGIFFLDAPSASQAADQYV